MDWCVDQAVKAHLIASEEATCTMSVRLRYSQRDPYAVHVTFPAEFSADQEAGSTWVFSRSLLDEGLRVPAGEGDVSFLPCGPLWTGVELHSEEGCVLVQFESIPLRRFLCSTYAIRPPGSERDGLDLDRELDMLLRGEGGGVRLQ
jgi:hypothetical protein